MNREEYLADPQTSEFTHWLWERLDTPRSFCHGYLKRAGGAPWSCENLYSAYEHYSGDSPAACSGDQAVHSPKARRFS